MPQWPDLQSLGVRVLALPPRRHARFPAGGIVLSGVTTPPEGFRRLSADALIRPGLRFTLGELRQWLRLAPETAVALLPFDRLAHTWQPPARRLRRRIVDVGEKVGGARKDRAGGRGTAETQFEVARRTTLESVWPRPPLAQWRAAGVRAEVAAAVMAVRAVPPRDLSHVAGQGEASIDEAQQVYRQALQALREAVEASPLPASPFDVFGRANRFALEHPQFALVDVLGRDSQGVPNHFRHREPTAHLHVRVLGGFRAADMLFYGHVALHGTVVRMRRRAVRLAARRGLAGASEAEALWLLLDPPPRAVGADRSAGAARPRTAPRHSHVDVERVGLPDYRQGRDVSAEALLQTFGLRGVEFGNWIPQAERQLMMNRGYEALCALADTLEVPREAIGLEGSLAAAFGARGRGGKGAAAAHFEPGRDVINLTRMKGAGTVAHEWWHALDRHLAKGRPAPVSGAGRWFFSEFVTSRTGRIAGRRGHTWTHDLSALRHWMADDWAPVRRALAGLMQVVYARPRTGREAMTSALSRFRYQSEAVCEWLQDSGVSAEQAGAFVTEALAHETRPGKEAAVLDLLRHFVRDPAQRKRLGELASDLAVAEQSARLRMQSADDPRARYGDQYLTRFSEDARKLGGSRAYWISPVEMSARAFEAWVHDELSARGRRDDYLVAPDRGLCGGRNRSLRYPGQDDRAAFGEHFAALRCALRDRFAEAPTAHPITEPAEACRSLLAA